MFDVERTRAALAELARRDRQRALFGAASHGYTLEPRLTDAEVREAEAQFGVALPEDYRAFLLELGAGGAGPSYGVFPLVRRKGVWRWEGDGAELTTDLRAPFPFTAEWNLDDDPLLDEEPSEDDFASDQAFDDAHAAWRDRVDERCFDAAHTRGAVCLCHLGCALRQWLVVTGPERGHMWDDDRADRGGLHPTRPDHARETFGSWYERWLANALADAPADGGA